MKNLSVAVPLDTGVPIIKSAPSTDNEDHFEIPGLEGVCICLEEQLRTAQGDWFPLLWQFVFFSTGLNLSGSGNRQQVRRLRRVLQRLYEALEVAALSEGNFHQGPPRVSTWVQQQQQRHLDNSDATSEDSFRSASGVIHNHNEVNSEAVPAAPANEATDSAVPASSEPTALTEIPAVSLYDEAIELALNGSISCRVDRTVEVQCSNRDDFLARLHCLRQGSTVSHAFE